MDSVILGYLYAVRIRNLCGPMQVPRLGLLRYTFISVRKKEFGRLVMRRFMYAHSQVATLETKSQGQNLEQQAQLLGPRCFSE